MRPKKRKIVLHTRLAPKARRAKVLPRLSLRSLLHLQSIRRTRSLSTPNKWNRVEVTRRKSSNKLSLQIKSQRNQGLRRPIVRMSLTQRMTANCH